MNTIRAIEHSICGEIPSETGVRLANAVISHGLPVKIDVSNVPPGILISALFMSFYETVAERFGLEAAKNEIHWKFRYAWQDGIRDIALEGLAGKGRAISDPIMAFLNSYGEYQGWKEKGWDAISRQLCEHYQYAPVGHVGREFLMIAFGFFWCYKYSENDMPYIEANCMCAQLKLELDKVYEVVAKENNW